MLEFLLTLWIMPLVVIGILIIAAINNNSVGGILALSGSAFLYTGIIYGFGNVLSWMWNNPAIIMLSIGLWIILGVFVSFILWDRYCRDRSIEWNKIKDNKTFPFSATTAEMIKNGTITIEKAMSNLKTSYIPKWYENKAKLAVWIVWWPFSLLNHICGKWLVDMLEWVQKQFGEVYNKLAMRHFQ